MSKVAQYLNEHLLGEVTTNDHVRRRYATDASILTIVPDMVIYPRATSDLRKVARFSWQLAEKGHKLPITPRGAGSDLTGGAIGSGVIVDMSAHMNTIFEIDHKQKLVRVQPGVSFNELNQSLRLQNLYIPSYPASHTVSTIGGAIANNASGVLSGKYGSTQRWVKQLEVVLSNGEVLQSGRLSKRDLQKKKGLQTFEGEIYRNIDNLITDNSELIDSIAYDIRDNAGYNIVDVKRRDGSIDLTPLFIGAQGTLGVISEVIMHAEPVSEAPLVGAIAFPDYESTRDGMDSLRSLDPTVLELVDARVLKTATDNGNHYPFYTDALERDEVAAVIVFEFDEHSSRAKKKIGKKVAKLFDQQPAYVVLEEKPAKAADLRALASITSLALIPDKGDVCAPIVLDGAYVPPERFEDFGKALAKLETKYHVELPLCGHLTQSVYHTRPLVDFKKPSERQKVLKLLAEWSTLVSAHGGHLIGESAEGRLKSIFAYKELEDSVLQMFMAIREVFDPMGIMNTGVKQAGELKKLVDELRPDYNDSLYGYIGKMD